MCNDWYSTVSTVVVLSCIQHVYELSLLYVSYTHYIHLYGVLGTENVLYLLDLCCRI